MKKKIVVEKVVCDICGQDAFEKCEICGKDICYDCARYICKKKATYPSASWSASYSPFEQLYTPEMTICKKCVDALKEIVRVSYDLLEKMGQPVF